MTIRVAHFAIFAPHASGQYGTVKDLILSERRVGIDAQFIDYGHEGKNESRVGLIDGNITTMPIEWALNGADVVFCHSNVPNKVLEKKPSILTLHGRPESSFRLEFHKISPIISIIIEWAKRKKYQTYVTFWPEHLFYWSRILPGEKIFYVPPPVDLDTFNPDGPKHDFGDKNGSPNILIADMWREDTTPFNVIFGAQYFKEHFCKEAKLHIYGLPHNNTCINFLSPLKKAGLIGEIFGVMRNIAEVYRAADMVITPNIIATRIVRESLASGIPIVAPHSCRYAKFHAEPRDVKDFGEAINRCWIDSFINKDKVKMEMRKIAETEFNFERAGQAIKQVCERVLA